MSLEVIGVGLGRTGTTSMRLALEQLGYGPCYNMAELGRRYEHEPLWISAASNKSIEWDTIFQGYRAAVGWPTAAFWRELAGEYPSATRR